MKTQITSKNIINRVDPNPTRPDSSQKIKSKPNSFIFGSYRVGSGKKMTPLVSGAGTEFQTQFRLLPQKYRVVISFFYFLFYLPKK